MTNYKAASHGNAITMLSWLVTVCRSGLRDARLKLVFLSMGDTPRCGEWRATGLGTETSPVVSCILLSGTTTGRIPCSKDGIKMTERHHGNIASHLISTSACLIWTLFCGPQGSSRLTNLKSSGLQQSTSDVETFSCVCFFPTIKISSVKWNAGSRHSLATLNDINIRDSRNWNIYTLLTSTEMSWTKQHTDCVCAMPTTAPTFPSRGSSQGPSFKRLVSASNFTTTSDKKRKVGGPPSDEPAVAQKRTVTTLLNSPSATNIESNGPWFTPLNASTQAEARLKSLDDIPKMDRPRDVSLQPHSMLQ
jgi:hypothetical protein